MNRECAGHHINFQSMQGQDNIISFGGTTARRNSVVLEPRARRIVDECRNLLARTLPHLMVGLFAEPKPPGFGFSDTAFRIFILMVSRRLKSDRFFLSKKSQKR